MPSNHGKLIPALIHRDANADLVINIYNFERDVNV